MAFYPTAIPNTTNYPNRTDDVDWLYAERYNEIKNEVIALCTELGISPSGGSATVLIRLATLALKSNVLELDNVSAFTPDADYEPATKKYVDDAAGAGDMAYADKRVHVGSFTRDMATASGTQAITGVGFTPVAVIFIGELNPTLKAFWGMSDNTSEKCIIHDPTPRFAINPTDCIYYDDRAANLYAGDISVFGADGFTINWTKTGSPTGTLDVYYIAFR